MDEIVRSIDDDDDKFFFVLFRKLLFIFLISVLVNSSHIIGADTFLLCKMENEAENIFASFYRRWQQSNFSYFFPVYFVGSFVCFWVGSVTFLYCAWCVHWKMISSFYFLRFFLFSTFSCMICDFTFISCRNTQVVTG